MNTKVWLETSFIDNDIPSWLCPNCEKGVLMLSKGKWFSKETESSKQSSEFVNTCDRRTHMTALLKCNKCSEYVTMVGYGQLREDFENIEEEGMKYFIEYTPEYFYPALHLFSIPNKCPQSVRKLITESFALYWSDTQACTGKIRVALEELMDCLGINKNKKLHKRIELLEDEELKKLLLSLKYIGNTGAHNENEVAEYKDIAYNILELVLNKLFDTNEKEIKDKADEINDKESKKHKVQ